MRHSSRSTTSGSVRFFRRLSPVHIEPAFDPGDLPTRTVTGEFWRQTAPHRHPLDLPERAANGARYHRKGQQGRVYASSTRDVSWGELFRYVPSGLSPFEIRRRMAHLQVRDLPVLDLTDPGVREMLGVTEQELVGNRKTACQAIATLVRRRPDRFGGILAPSAADPSAQTLVVFAEWLDHIDVVHFRVGRPPLRLADLFARVIGTLQLSLQDDAMAILRDIRRAIRRRIAR